MSLVSGQKLGPHEIIEAAGAGGMGEVYKAKDTRLDRTVAIKVLPAPTAHNADLRARFEREARAISSLNHPNICTLYDIGHEGGMDYLVMEFLEGETLGERIKKGPVDISEVFDIAIEIADALDKAHRQGLVHRDLKPGNVILTKEGAKLLDFGLAKLQVSGGVVDGISGITQTTPLTGSGTIIGTIQYMSPEQLEGSEADARSDIFAFGALLYEMISCSKAFAGKSQASLIASILKEQPRALSELVPMSPPGLDRLVRKCLAKDPDDRWQSARDLCDELRWIAQSGSQAGVPAPVAAKRRLRFRLVWAVAAAAVCAAGLFAFMWFTRPEPVENVVRFSVSPGENVQSMSWPQISPDGRYLAFKATDSAGRDAIWVRPLNSEEAFPLNGTAGALRPFWSPDSRYLAFSVSNNQLKKVPINGGPPQLIGEIERVADGTWGTSGIILFDGSTNDSLRYVSASGGVASQATSLNTEKGERLHAWPEFLPDGRHFLYLSSTDSLLNEAATYMLSVGSLDSHDVIELFPTSSKVEYCEPGYLVYVRDRILLAQAFDAGSLEITGEPIPIAENVAGPSGLPIAYFDVSDEGTLVYLTSDASAKNELVWVDRTGRELARIDAPARYGDVALSPDGGSLVYGLEDPQSETTDLWMYDLKRGVSSRFTFNDGNEFGPVWTHDGSEVYFGHGSFPQLTSMVKLANGTGDAVSPFDSTFSLMAVTDISRDNSRAALTVLDGGPPDIYVKDLNTDEAPYPIIQTPLPEYLGKFSPDGRYIAYGAQETERAELYLRQLGGAGGKWQISTSGLRQFEWNPAGDEILYFSQDWDLMSVPVRTDRGLEIGSAKKLFRHRLSTLGFDVRRFAVSNDGQKFLLVSAQNQKENLAFSVVLNWHKTIEAD
jgi:serine/threonine protein kinase